MIGQHPEKHVTFLVPCSVVGRGTRINGVVLLCSLVVMQYCCSETGTYDARIQLAVYTAAVQQNANNV